MDAQITSYDHGWTPCRTCHAGRSKTQRERWHLTANPGYWGARNPSILVLGFSKGAMQVGAIEKEPFEQVAFKAHRRELQRILKRLGVDFAGQTIEETMTARSRCIGYASLVRCSIAHEKKGTLVSSGTIMTDAVADPWVRGVMSECVRQHLLPMPESVQRVVLLSNDARYISGVRSLVREHYSDFSDINDMGFFAGGRRWVFAIHPAARGAHVPDWLEGDPTDGLGLKRELAITAFGSPESSLKPALNIGKKRLIKAVLA
jgi:hypothetical protein